jgi:hypothetical protein
VTSLRGFWSGAFSLDLIRNAHGGWANVQNREKRSRTAKRFIPAANTHGDVHGLSGPGTQAGMFAGVVPITCPVRATILKMIFFAPGTEKDCKAVSAMVG